MQGGIFATVEVIGARDGENEQVQVWPAKTKTEHAGSIMVVSKNVGWGL